eukprot:3672249-Alexandrium_andersonii.AAC.1
MASVAVAALCTEKATGMRHLETARSGKLAQQMQRLRCIIGACTSPPRFALRCSVYVYPRMPSECRAVSTARRLPARLGA